MKSLFFKILLVITTFYMVGCSNQPMVIPLPESSLITNSTVENKPRIEEVQFINKAQEGELVNPITPFSDSFIPINPETPVYETVESDIKNFIDTNSISGSKEDKSLRVIIEEADAYWVYGGLDKAPFINLLIVGNDKSFGLNLKVRFEIEVNGKVASTYTYKDNIVINGSAAFTDDIKDSYTMLISEYRRQFFNELKDELFKRYL
ncbi:hypothetical protein [Endozoicomonas ascidiicola]|uniref:hypothetical protein n=1 Tax=Endozoicomonas ascidiicola TaxID=1698521 RepID=UPI0008316E84|nr:hypothetical protein [Endozoicomonas ascidiicola]